MADPPLRVKADSNEVAVEGLKPGAGEVMYETFTLVADAARATRRSREPASPAPVTMLDYMGSPVVT